MFTGDPRQHVHVVRIMSAGRRMHDGWRRVDGGGPVQRVLAGAAVLLLAVPMLVLLALAVFTIVVVGMAAGLIAWLFGGRPRVPNPDAGRENVRVIRRDT
jgi:cobalamin biosynthesis protein CobD/CbiB